MSSIDERVVKMRFDNASFKKGAIDTEKSLADLNKAVDGAGKSKGLLSLSDQMSRVAITASKMQVVTTTALATIANKVVNVGLNVAKALTFDPIRSGFLEYESLLTKQNTIMNATGKSAEEVKAVLNSLNRYSDKTIYSFSNMTESITKFVNAGVGLKDAASTVKGIANAAAFAGASTEDANRAMFAFSQSIANGFLTLGDFNQIESANMATVQFKETLLEAAAAAGTLRKEGDKYVTASGERITATEGFQYSLQEQWATTEVLNTALAKYTDTSTKLGKQATKSATEVRTFTAFMDTLKESIGSGWSQLFTSLVGNLKQATSFWTGLSQSVGNAVGNVFHFLSVTLKTWRKMGGFEKTVQGFKNILAPFAALLTAIGDAWSAAFPSSDKGAGKALYGLSAGFEAVTRPLQWLAALIEGTTPALTVFFRLLGIGYGIVKNIATSLWDLGEALATSADFDAPASGGFLGFLQDVRAAVGDAIDKVKDLVRGASSLGGLFGGVDVDIPGLGGGDAASAAGDVAQKQADGASRVLGGIKSVAVKIGETIANLWDGVKSMLSKVSVEDLVRIFNQALFTAFAVNVIRMSNAITKAFKAFSEIGDGVAGVLDGAGGALKSFQTQAQAKLILNLAIAIGILAASLWVLSKIPPDKLASAGAALAGIMLMLNVNMKQFTKTVGVMARAGAIGNTLALSAAMVALAGSMILLSTALLIMNKVDWTSLVKGIGSMIVMMKVLESIGNLGAGAAKNLVGAAVAIAAVAGSMVILAGALLLFKLIKWGEIGKAGAVLGGLALAVGLLALIPYQGIAKVGLALLVASVGMIAMANALLIFEMVEWGSIGKAAVVLGMLAVALGVIIALGGPASVAGMLGLAGAMLLLSVALIALNEVEWASLAKAAVALTALMLAFAVGATILAAFLYVIAPVTPVLIALAVAFALLGAGLLAFAAAMAIAMTVGAAGVAVFAALATGAATAIAVFLQTLALQAPVMKDAVLDILQNFIDGIVEAVPMIVKGVQRIWDAFMTSLMGKEKKKDLKDQGKGWLEFVAEGLQDRMPLIVAKASLIIIQFLNELSAHMAQISAAGVEVLVQFINGVTSKVDRVATAVRKLFQELLKAMALQYPKMAEAGIKTVFEFGRGLVSGIAENVSKMVADFFNLGVDLVQGLIDGVGSMVGAALSAVGGLAGSMVSTATKIFDVHSPSRVFMDIGKFVVMGLTQGIQNHAASAIAAVASMVHGSIAMADSLVSKFIQKLDQSAIAARAKAEGIAAAARRAEREANKTKTKADDKAAQRLARAARKADRQADKADKEAQEARRREARKDRWESASLQEKAEIRSNDSQRQINAAKAAEKRAAANLAEADALERMAKADGVTEKQRKEYERRAEKLRREAREEAKRANELMRDARESAASALVWQRKAGEEAAQSFQEQFDAQAQADADAEAFDKLSDAEKAKKLREQAEAMQKKAEDDLKRAKLLALTDVDKANELAQQAMDEAQRARDLIDQAEDLENNPSNRPGTTLDLTQTAAAAAAAARYAEQYQNAYAAAAGGIPGVTFNQYNNSPEALDTTTIYRQTNNQVTYAADQLVGAP